MSLHTLKRHARSVCLTALSVAVLAACNSNDPEKLMASANEAFAKREVSAAAIQVKNVLQQNPDNAQARLLFGQILLAQHDPAGGRMSCARRATRALPSKLMRRCWPKP